MFAGPIFQREALILPRQLRHFLMRAGYVFLLLVLMYTAAQATFGFQQVRSIGDYAQFGKLIFQLFSLVQLVLVLFFALLFAAGSIAQEKDRRTLVLLLMTDLKNRELVQGKMFASLLNVGVLLLISLPVYCLIKLLGGFTFLQIGCSLAICAASAYAVGSWGALVAFWREKTFQTLSISLLGLILFLLVMEVLFQLLSGFPAARTIAVAFHPFRTLIGVLDPFGHEMAIEQVPKLAMLCVGALTGLGLMLNLFSAWRLRVWNPSRSIYEAVREAEKREALEERNVSKRSLRQVWNNPVIWREIRTRAYGRKVALIKAVYVLVAIWVGYLVWQHASVAGFPGMMSHPVVGFLGLSLMSLLLINAQGVTAITSERDGQTLELLLVTDITAREFIYGKLGGVLYNAKELIIAPIVLMLMMFVNEWLSGENLVYVFIGFQVLVLFAAMLGVHSGLSFESSRTAIANSLGTLFFLFIGIMIFMVLLVEAQSSFLIQFQSFLIFIVIGSVGLYLSLTHKNPSPALTLAAGILPFLTFYAITEFLLGGTLGVCLAVAAAYGFATRAMLVPAVSEFDVALGRTTFDAG